MNFKSKYSSFPAKSWRLKNIPMPATMIKWSIPIISISYFNCWYFMLTFDFLQEELIVAVIINHQSSLELNIFVHDSLTDLCFSTHKCFSGFSRRKIFTKRFGTYHGCCHVLVHFSNLLLLIDSSKFYRWNAFNNLIRTFVIWKKFNYSFCNYFNALLKFWSMVQFSRVNIL